MIRAYPGSVTVSAGDVLRLHVATDAATFRVELVRCGEHSQKIHRQDRCFTGTPGVEKQAELPWNWRAYEIPLPRGTPGGAYIAVLHSEPPESPIRASATLVPDARSARALFVVRNAASHARLLVVLPIFTYHAYNVATVDGTLGNGEGACLYSGAFWVSLHRPGGGIGGHPWDEVNADAYDRGSPRQTFAHWDAKAIAWLEREGYAYDCCTDHDVHTGAIDLGAYRAIVSFGHHEYWTAQMRKRVESYVHAGGNVAFFGGNTCWFRLEYDPQHEAIRRAGRWVEDPEWRFTGTSYAFGGGKWIGERPPTGYRIIQPRHWIYQGLSARVGDTFGFEERLIGYECDAAPPQSDLDVLADASIAHWQTTDGSGERSKTARATLGTRSAGGTIFNAATVDWARVLFSGDRYTHTITRNVLNRFLS